MPGISLIVFSGDYDRAMAAFTIANGAAGEDQPVTMFFTFWGISLLRKTSEPGGNPLQRMFKRMLPVGPSRPGLSRYNFGGLGSFFLRRLIRQKKSQCLPELIETALARHVNLVACKASLALLGIERNELLATDQLRVDDVHGFLAVARASDLCLFV